MTDDSLKLEFLGEKYFLIPRELIANGVEIDFPLSFHMPLNNNLVLLFRIGSTPNSERMQKYEAKGLVHFVCPEIYYPNWLKYLQRTQIPLSVQDAGIDLSTAAETLAKGEMSRDDKKEFLIGVGRKMTELLSRIADGDEDSQRAAMEECQKVSRELVQMAMQSHASKSAYDSLLMLQEGALEHSTAVSTIAVIFALSCGFVEDSDLAEISMGSLLHDLGHSQLDVDLFENPFDKFNGEQKEKFVEHTRIGLDLLAQLGEDVPPLVRQIIELHHERFDGHGFPKGMSGFEIDERVQLICLADHVDDLMSGAMTGTKLSPVAAFEWLKSNDMSSPDAQMVSADLFHSVYQIVLKTKPSEVESAA